MYNTIEEIENRMAEIKAEIEKADEERMTALETEVADLETRKAEIIEARKKDVENVINAKDTEPIIKEKKMDNNEIRSSKAYIDAYANYIKTGRDDECRALLTQNASGVVPVPVLVEDVVRTAWENDPIMSRVRKTFFRGNLKVAFERSADGAYVHTEGTSAPTEESLLIGIVTMVPATVKKWLSISTEAAALGGEAFLRYIYDELTHRIVLKLSALIVSDIAGLSTSNSGTAVGAAKVTMAPGLATIPTAYASLSDEAINNVIIMNRLTYANFIAAQVAGNFASDPFMGLPVLFSSALPAYDSASTNDVYAIVGDLDGAQVNYPEGDNVVIIYNNLSRAKEDMDEVIGRQYAAHAVTAPFRFTNIAKPAPAATE